MQHVHYVSLFLGWLFPTGFNYCGSYSDSRSYVWVLVLCIPLLQIVEKALLVRMSLCDELLTSNTTLHLYICVYILACNHFPLYEYQNGDIEHRQLGCGVRGRLYVCLL